MRERTILLINPPSPPVATANREGAGGLGYLDHVAAGFTYPPQTIAATAAVLRANGWTPRVLDAVGEGLDLAQTLHALRDSGAATFAVLVSHETLAGDVAFLSALRQELPERQLLAFGVSTAHAQQGLAQQMTLDGVLFGEPELAVGVAAAALHDSRVADRPLFLSPDSLSVGGYDERGLIADLDALPFPAWDLTPVERYRFLTIMASRGCDATCRYCPYVVAQGNRFRPRAPERVVEEMVWLAKTFHPRRVVFRDPVFARDRDRVVAICEGILARRPTVNNRLVPWECESRPEHLNEALLKLMQRAGCYGIKVGLETASPSLLCSLHRTDALEEAHRYREQVATLIRTCRTLEMQCHLFIMIGLPGQTPFDLQETLSFLRGVRPSALNIKMFIPYPGIQISRAELASITPPDEEMVRALFRLKRECEGIRLTRRTLWQRARGWLQRHVGGER